MSRYSDDSDSDSSQRRSKKKKHKRSRSRSREKKSRHRSRTRSRDRRRRSRSRSKERRHRNRDRNRRRSRSRDRRSRSLSSSRSREDVSSSRVSSRDTSEVAVVEERQPVPSSTITNIADQLKRARAIAEIDSESFSQKGFRSSGIRSVKMDAGVEEIGFEFGTSIERKQISEAEENLEKINKEGIFHPALFGDQPAREKRYLQHIWTIRQRALQKN